MAEDYTRPDQTGTEHALTPDDVRLYDRLGIDDPGHGHESHPLVYLFTPASRIHVLTALLTNRGEFLSVGDIVDASDETIGRHVVYDHIDVLVDAGLVEKGKTANAATYRINLRHPIVQTLLMQSALATHGETPQYVEEQFLTFSSSA